MHRHACKISGLSIMRALLKGSGACKKEGWLRHVSCSMCLVYRASSDVQPADRRPNGSDHLHAVLSCGNMAASRCTRLCCDLCVEEIDTSLESESGLTCWNPRAASAFLHRRPPSLPLWSLLCTAGTSAYTRCRRLQRSLRSHPHPPSRTRPRPPC